MTYPPVMADPSPRSLAEMMRSTRRMWGSLLALGATYIAWQVVAAIIATANPDLPRILRTTLGPAGILLLPVYLLGLVVFMLVKGRFRERALDMLVTRVGDEPAFVVPFTVQRWSQLPINLAAALVVQLGLQITPMVIFDDYGIVISFVIFVIVPIAISVGAFVFGLRRGSHRLVLTPAGLRVPTFLGSRALAWTALAPGGPVRPRSNREGIWVRFHHRPYELRFFSQLVHQSFVADVIRYYVEHPEQRAEIGTAAEHDRLLSALGVPAASSAGVTGG